MTYRVNRPFRWGGRIRMPGHTLELDAAEARQLQIARKISGPERAVAPPAERAVPEKPERTVKPPTEKRRKKAEHEPDTGDSAGD